jgi:hypothetical protein
MDQLDPESSPSAPQRTLLSRLRGNVPAGVDQFSLECWVNRIDPTSPRAKQYLTRAGKLVETVVWLSQLERRVERSFKETPIVRAINTVVWMERPRRGVDDGGRPHVEARDEIDDCQRNRLIGDLWNLSRKAAFVLSFVSTLPTNHPLRTEEFPPLEVARSVVALDRDCVETCYRAAKELEGGVWRLDVLQELDWRDVERLVAAFLSEWGHLARRTADTHDHGVDVWALVEGRKVACEVKHRPSGDTVGRPTVQKLVSHLAAGMVTGVLLITTGSITTPAERYATKIDGPVKLVDGDQFVKLLSRSSIPEPSTL